MRIELHSQLQSADSSPPDKRRNQTWTSIRRLSGDPTYQDFVSATSVS
jgi:hypothetical protein